jgi:hypothetical protein
VRLIDLGVVYALLGVACAVTVARRHRRGAADLLLSLVLWPLYLPVVLAPPSRREEGTDAASGGEARIRREHDLLLAALEGVRDPVAVKLLPRREHLARLAEHLSTLDAKVRELDEVLGQPEFEREAAERAVREAEPQGGSALENATLALASVQRLETLRRRAATERDELLSLCTRLRMQVTVLRFAGAASTDVGDLVAEILGRVEGVGAAVDVEQHVH